jgi:hypothetical protein
MERSGMQSFPSGCGDVENRLKNIPLPYFDFPHFHQTRQFP